MDIEKYEQASLEKRSQTQTQMTMKRPSSCLKLSINQSQSLQSSLSIQKCNGPVFHMRKKSFEKDNKGRQTTIIS